MVLTEGGREIKGWMAVFKEGLIVLCGSGKRRKLCRNCQESSGIYMALMRKLFPDDVVSDKIVSC